MLFCCVVILLCHDVEKELTKYLLNVVSSRVIQTSLLVFGLDSCPPSLQLQLHRFSGLTIPLRGGKSANSWRHRPHQLSGGVGFKAP